MHSRILALFDAMLRIADLIDHQPQLQQQLAESTAFTHFHEALTRFDALREEEAASELEIRELRAQRRVLAAEVQRALRRIRATAELIPASAEVLPVMARDKRMYLPRFTPAAMAYVDRAQLHIAAFVDAGMHPRALDDARALIERLIDVDRRCLFAEATAGSLPARIEIVTTAARKRVRQLYFELHGVMTPDARIAWQQAASLGRVHRAKALSSGPAMKQLGPGTVDDAL